jgi:hypothetical protein
MEIRNKISPVPAIMKTKKGNKKQDSSKTKKIRKKQLFLML